MNGEQLDLGFALMHSDFRRCLLSLKAAVDLGGKERVTVISIYVQVSCKYNM